MKSSNKGAASSNFSLKCVKSLQKCVKDLKKWMRQMQFESQRIQKHQIQQILNNSSNLLVALTSCNLYRINFQEEAYYLTQLQKIERGIDQIGQFVSQLCSRNYFTSLSNNKQSEDLFNQLEITFDTFVGPLLHIFNSFNISWLLYYCDTQKLFLLDEFNLDTISQKLGLPFNTETSHSQWNQENNQKESLPNLSVNSSDMISTTSLQQQQQQQYSQNESGSSTRNSKINIAESNANVLKLIELKQIFKEGKMSKKQFINDLLGEYKCLVPENENSCLSEFAIIIDLMSDHIPSKYSHIFVNYYTNLFDPSTSEKVSNILNTTNNFSTLNKYARMIFYNTDIMSLPFTEILQFLHSSTNYNLKDLHIKLERSGLISLPIPLTNSPIIKERRSISYKNQSNTFSSPNKLKQQKSRNISLQGNQNLSSSNIKVGSVISMCPHTSNFFSFVPRADYIQPKTTPPNIKHHNDHDNENSDADDERKVENVQINCHYIQQQIDSKKHEDEKLNLQKLYFSKRSNTLSQRQSELTPNNIGQETQNHQNSHLVHQNSVIAATTDSIEIQPQKDCTAQSNENNISILKKREILFGRKANNNIIKPDFFFEEHENTISRQQFKITYEDQSNEYNIQCMSHSSLTQFAIDEQGFELTAGAVIIIQDLIAFQIVNLKQFSEQPSCNPNTIPKIFNKNQTKISSESSQNLGEKEQTLRKQQFQTRKKSGRLSYKNSLLFDDYEVTVPTAEIKATESDEQPTSKSNSQDEVNNGNHKIVNKNGENSDNNKSEDDESQASNSSNSLSEKSEISSQMQSSQSSFSSISGIELNSIQQLYERRTSMNTRKTSFINQIRKQNSRKSSLQIYLNQTNFQSTEPLNDNKLLPKKKSQDVSTLISHSSLSLINKKQMVSESEQENNVSQKSTENNSEINQPKEKPQINLIECSTTNEGEEVTQDFKKQSNSQLLDKQQWQQSYNQQTNIMNGMSLSSSKLMLQSSLTMNQSVYSIAGLSLNEIDDEPYKEEALLHIRVLWSTIDTEKEDYIFHYHNQTDRDSIVINIGSDKENQIIVKDENNAIKQNAHCTITIQDNTWTILTQHTDPKYYSGLTLKKMEEIENGLISKKILIENGLNILVQGYIFSCRL